jgi:hypothetical protein
MRSISTYLSWLVEIWKYPSHLISSLFRDNTHQPYLTLSGGKVSGSIERRFRIQSSQNTNTYSCTSQISWLRVIIVSSLQLFLMVRSGASFSLLHGLTWLRLSHDRTVPSPSCNASLWIEAPHQSSTSCTSHTTKYEGKPSSTYYAFWYFYPKEPDQFSTGIAANNDIITFCNFHTLNFSDLKPSDC